VINNWRQCKEESFAGTSSSFLTFRRIYKILFSITVLLYLWKIKRKVPEMDCNNTGTLFYLTNIVCHFLAAHVSYKLCPLICPPTLVEIAADATNAVGKIHCIQAWRSEFYSRDRANILYSSSDPRRLWDCRLVLSCICSLNWVS
jgi:hypothetical protein